MASPLPRVLAAFAGLCLSACAGTLPPISDSQPQRITTQWPEIGQEHTADVGAVIIRQGSESRQEGIAFDAPNNIDGLVLSAGFYPQISADENHTYHAFLTAPSANGFGHILPTRDIIGGWIEAPRAIRAARNRQETCVIFREMLGVPCDRKVPYTRLTKSWLSQGDLQRELIYDGRAGERLRFRHIERSGHFARPEKAEPVELAIDEQGEIAFSGARIRVYQMDDAAIRYTVLAPFTDYWGNRKR